MAITLGTDGYCELADIQAMHQQRTIGASTKPTSTQVETQITEDFELINSFLDTAGYTIPVAVLTYTESAKTLKRINRLLSGAWTEEAAYSAGIGGVSEKAERWEKQAMDLLKLIAAGKMSLTDAPKAGDAVALANDQTPLGTFNLDTDGDEIDSTFTRETLW